MGGAPGGESHALFAAFVAARIGVLELRTATDIEKRANSTNIVDEHGRLDSSCPESNFLTQRGTSSSESNAMSRFEVP